MNLLDKIDELHAKEVTPEEFEATWGFSIEDHLADMMEVVKQQRSKNQYAKRTTARKSALNRATAMALAKKAAAATSAAAAQGHGDDHKEPIPGKTDISNPIAVSHIEGSSLRELRPDSKPIDVHNTDNNSRIRACKSAKGRRTGRKP